MCCASWGTAGIGIRTRGSDERERGQALLRWAVRVAGRRCLRRHARHAISGEGYALLDAAAMAALRTRRGGRCLARREPVPPAAGSGRTPELRRSACSEAPKKLASQRAVRCEAALHGKRHL